MANREPATRAAVARVFDHAAPEHAGPVAQALGLRTGEEFADLALAILTDHEMAVETWLGARGVHVPLQDDELSMRRRVFAALICALGTRVDSFGGWLGSAVRPHWVPRVNAAVSALAADADRICSSVHTRPQTREVTSAAQSEDDEAVDEISDEDVARYLPEVIAARPSDRRRLESNPAFARGAVAAYLAHQQGA